MLNSVFYDFADLLLHEVMLLNHRMSFLNKDFGIVADETVIA